MNQPVLFTSVIEEAAQYGYRAPTAARAAGITYRQLDYWARTSIVKPSIGRGRGSGTPRLYSLHDVVVLSVVRNLCAAGIGLGRVRDAVQSLRARDVTEAGAMLLYDGIHTHVGASSDSIISALDHGQAVFTIGLGSIAHDVSRDLIQSPGHDAVALPVP